MVPKGDAVILQGIDKVHFDIPAQDGEIGRSLAEVACVEEEDIPLPIRLDDAVTAGSPLDGPAQSGLIAGPFRLQMAVGIVEMHDCKPLLRLYIHCAQRSQKADGRY